MKMSKEQFLAMAAAMYSVGNASDAEDNPNKEWTRGIMAGSACCAHLDAMMEDLLMMGIVSHAEFDVFYSGL